jgi:hypothetical protein
MDQQLPIKRKVPPSKPKNESQREREYLTRDDNTRRGDDVP